MQGACMMHPALHRGPGRWFAMQSQCHHDGQLVHACMIDS
eukprot:SAG22_NODE_987_length_6142_cov_3.152242_5_plen_40_part_00